MGFGSKLKKAGKKATGAATGAAKKAHYAAAAAAKKKAQAAVAAAKKAQAAAAAAAKKKAQAAAAAAAKKKAQAAAAAAKKVRTAQKQVQKVANTPIVKTAVTAVATTVAGPAGASMVETGYSALNSSNPMDLLIGSVSPSYLITKGYINQYKDSTVLPEEYDTALSTVLPEEYDTALSTVLPEEYDISYAGISTKLLKPANCINDTVKSSTVKSATVKSATVKSAQGKKKGLIAEILSWFGF